MCDDVPAGESNLCDTKEGGIYNLVTDYTKRDQLPELIRMKLLPGLVEEKSHRMECLTMEKDLRLWSKVIEDTYNKDD